MNGYSIALPGVSLSPHLEVDLQFSQMTRVLDIVVPQEDETPIHIRFDSVVGIRLDSASIFENQRQYPTPDSSIIVVEDSDLIAELRDADEREDHRLPEDFKHYLFSGYDDTWHILARSIEIVDDERP